jgi:hypothetical protein
LNYYNLYDGETLQSFSDKTGAPGPALDVLYATPPSAVSAATWSFGSQTWSDRIQASPPKCSLVAALSSSSLTSEYVEYNGIYFYKWHCLANNQEDFCPNPWRVPAISDFTLLISSTNSDNLKTIWPGTGRFSGGGYAWPTVCYALAVDLAPNNRIYAFDTGNAGLYTLRDPSDAHPVRCVK